MSKKDDHVFEGPYSAAKEDRMRAERVAAITKSLERRGPGPKAMAAEAQAAKKERADREESATRAIKARDEQLEERLSKMTDPAAKADLVAREHAWRQSVGLEKKPRASEMKEGLKKVSSASTIGSVSSTEVSPRPRSPSPAGGRGGR